MTGTWFLLLKGRQAHRQMHTTEGGGYHDSTMVSNHPSHTRQLSSSCTDGLLNDWWDQSGGGRFCSHLDRCFHMWQLYLGIFTCSFTATSSLCCRYHPHELYVCLHFLMPLRGEIWKLNTLRGNIRVPFTLLRRLEGFDTDSTGGISLASKGVFYTLSMLLLQTAKQESALHHKPQSLSGSVIRVPE